MNCGTSQGIGVKARPERSRHGSRAFALDTMGRAADTAVTEFKARSHLRLDYGREQCPSSRGRDCHAGAVKSN
jgi:hypothetical protein